MTVGKSGEVKLNCGGVADLTVTAAWEERLDASAGSSVIAVTGMMLTAAETGRYTLRGAVSMGGAVLGRLTDCTADVAERGVPTAVTGDCFPIVSTALYHRERETASAVLQLAGEAPTGQQYYASGRISVELSMQPLISEVTASAQFIGSPISVAIMPADGSAVHTLRYAFGDMSGEIGRMLSGGGHTWTPSMELCAAIPDRGTGDCEIFCDTYMGGALVGTTSCVVSLWVPIQVSLELADGWVILEPANEGTAAEGMDCYVQGFSRVRAVFDESKIDSGYAYGAYPVAFSMTVGGMKCDAPYVSHVVHSYGELPVRCSVTDSRGRVYEEALSISVLPYTPPVLGDVDVFRCDTDGTANERGDCLSVSVGYGVCSLGDRNHGTVSVKRRMMGSDWSETVTLADAVPAVLWAGEISPNDTYEVLVQVMDALGRSASVTVTLPCTNVFFHGREGGLGAAFGKRAEEDGVLEVAWSLKTKGDLVVEGSVTVGGKALWEQLYPVGTVCGCHVSADPAALFGGTWVQADDAVRYWVRTE